MLKSFFTVEEPEEEKTGIEWLDTAITLALYLVAETMKEYREIKDRKLAESGKAVVLKTNDTET